MSSPALVRGLGLTAAIAIGIAEVIGTGVFLKARVMTCNVETPWLVLTVWVVAGLLSLAGVPGTAGFAGKFFIFRSAVESNHTGLAIIGVLTTVVSFYYYLYVIVQMYMREPGEDFSDARVTPAIAVALLIAAAGTVYLGILPDKLLEWTTASALHLLN